MNDNAKIWIEALRSTEYKQGVGGLHPSEGKFCCLGVACDKYKEITGQGEWLSDRTFIINRISRISSLPVDVRDWLGLADIDGAFADGCLADINDDGASFEQIADIIESEPEGLFK